MLPLRRLKNILNRSRRLLRLTSWSIEVIIIKNKNIITKNKKLISSESDFYAMTEEIDSTKRKFIIYVNEILLKQKDKAITKVIVHELLHILFWKMLDFSTQIHKNKIEREEHFVIEKLVNALVI
ncbi:MAG: hypothetical protein WC755_09750 [Candidatus Woesearchaeota archaeon]